MTIVKSIIVFTLVKFTLLALLSSHAIASPKLRVFACEPEWKSLVEELGGEYVDAFSATTAFQDPHYIEARPSLIAKVRRADLLVCTGAELEIGWLPVLLRQSGNAAIQVGQPGYFLAASQVDRIEIPTELDRSHGDVHASGNPHVHWDPERVLVVAKALSHRLQTIDTKHAGIYRDKLDRFSQRWQSAILEWRDQTAELRGKKAIVYHKNWSYLLNWLGMTLLGDLEPKPGLPPTSAHLASLLDTVRSHRPDIILIANYQRDKGAKWLSKKSDLPLLQLPFTVGGSKKSTTLFSLYDEVFALLNRDLQ